MRLSVRSSGPGVRGEGRRSLIVLCRLLCCPAAARQSRAALRAVLVAFVLSALPVLAADPVVTLGSGPLTVAIGPGGPFHREYFRGTRPLRFRPAVEFRPDRPRSRGRRCECSGNPSCRGQFSVSGLRGPKSGRQPGRYCGVRRNPTQPQRSQKWKRRPVHGIISGIGAWPDKPGRSQ